MTYKCRSKAHAEACAARLNEREGNHLTRFEAAPYAQWPLDLYTPRRLHESAWTWGVVRRWQYAHRPDLGWLHGGFVWGASDMASVPHAEAR